ncbi:ABC transporter permease [Methylocapsa sp. S129]|uniref:ABC transporter permease n=1 Tax=Methylocapsa sp. S129 TaxID=1641869 RepID=UPI00131B23BA|nr:ABC transporter permease [Methylocapsa sp. S129]
MTVSAVAYAVTVFLLLPTILIIPMSFGPDRYLHFPPNGFTLHWYAEFFADPEWVDSTLFSLRIAVLTMIVATVVGTLVSLALVRGRLPGKSLFELLVVGPVIVPNIALAIAMFLVFDRLRLTGTTVGFVVAHTALALPFVIFTLLASLYRFDADLERAALSCGAGPLRAFFHVTLPLIAPGVVSAALFAFIISFDEPVISFFISDLDHKSLPRKMFEDIDYNISPTLAAVATMLTGLTLLALTAGHFLRRGMSRS